MEAAKEPSTTASSMPRHLLPTGPAAGQLGRGASTELHLRSQRSKDLIELRHFGKFSGLATHSTHAQVQRMLMRAIQDFQQRGKTRQVDVRYS
jgi:hypothetical protein